MGDWLLAIFGVIGDAIGWLATTLVGSTVDVVRWLLLACKDIASDLFSVLFSLLPPAAVQYIEAIPFQTLYDYVGGWAWIFPVNGVVTTVFTTYAVCGVIRLVRWILALVPTVGG